MSVDEAEVALRGALTRARDGGARIVRDEFGVIVPELSGVPCHTAVGGPKCCCAFGALLLAEAEIPRANDGTRPNAYEAASALAARRFGWTSKEFNAFLSGFDNETSFDCEDCVEAAELGKKLSLEFVGPFPEIDEEE